MTRRALTRRAPRARHVHGDGAPAGRRTGARTGAARRASGFAIVAVLVLVGLMVALGTTYTRHAFAREQHRFATRSAVEAREAAHSGLLFGQQSLHADAGPTTAVIAHGAEQAVVEVEELADDRGSIRVTSLDGDGLGATVLVEVGRRPVPFAGEPDDLPHLGADTIADLLADPTIPKHHYAGLAWVTDQDLYGLVVIHDSSAVYFEDVTIEGCIVSEDALDDDPFGPYDELTVPCALVAGDLRVRPADFLPGLAVLMPDGAFTESSRGASVQIEGDVVAHEVSLDVTGAIHGNVAAVEPLDLAAAIDRPGQGRGGRAWASGLVVEGGFDTAFLAFVPRHRTVGELAAITGYAFGTP